LESIVGEQVLQKALHTYFMKYRFTHPTQEDFLRTVNEVAGQDLTWYWQQAVYGTQVLDYKVRKAESVRVDCANKDAPDEKKGETLSSLILERFKVGGTDKDRLRLMTVLDRLAATFGVDSVSTYIIDDPGYNAALVPSPSGFSLFVTSALMSDFELIELEGVVAHCLARQRLDLVDRQSVSAVANISDEQRKQLAGEGMAYRADEVAAAAIRYPLGIAGALRRCEHHATPSASFFVTPTFAQWRWIWFDVWADRRGAGIADLDDVELRALALEEW